MCLWLTCHYISWLCVAQCFTAVKPNSRFKMPRIFFLQPGFLSAKNTYHKEHFTGTNFGHSLENVMFRWMDPFLSAYVNTSVAAAAPPCLQLSVMFSRSSLVWLSLPSCLVLFFPLQRYNSARTFLDTTNFISMIDGPLVVC